MLVHQPAQLLSAGGLNVNVQVRVRSKARTPRLFNLCMSHLIDELCNNRIGCSVNGTIVNNISYGDNIVLLSSSISALHKLVSSMLRSMSFGCLFVCFDGFAEIM